MSEQREPYITMTEPLDISGEIHNPIVINFNDWRYNALMRLEQLAHSGRMIIIDGDAHCWYEVGKLECNKADRGLPFKM